MQNNNLNSKTFMCRLMISNCNVSTQLVQIGGLSISLKVINQVEDPKYILTNILNLTPVDTGCETNLTF